MKTSKTKLFLTIRKVLMLCTLIPIIVSSLMIIYFANSKLHDIMYEYRLAQLESVAMVTKMNIETHGSLENAREYLDNLQSETGIEMTIINGQTRYITTLKDVNGNYITGTDIDRDIYNTLKTGKSYSNYDVVINGKDYLVIYLPIMVDNEYVGSVFTGYEKSVTEHEVLSVICTFIITTAEICILFTILIIFISKLVSLAMNRLLTNLNHMKNGDLKSVKETKQHIREFKEIDLSLTSLNVKLTEVVGNVTNAAVDLDNITDSVSSKCSVVSQGISDIGTASEEIANGSGNLAESAQDMNKDLIDIGDDINTIRSKVEGVYESTMVASETGHDLVINLAKLISANGETKDYTNEVVRSINETAEAINKIGNAATFIESIAEQTNLLSLNASIEAARAGEAGRGFSVVATEIKNLAEQSAESANEVQTIIKTIIEKSNQNTLSANAIATAVDSEMKLLHVVKDGITDISEKVENVNADMLNVKNTTIDIDRKKSDILDNISSLSSVSEENAAMTEETNATVEELSANMSIIDQESKDVADQSRLLLETIKFFNV